MDRGANARVLLIEDDDRTAAFVADNLRADGFEVTLQAGGEIDLIVFDTNAVDVFTHEEEGVPVIALVQRLEQLPSYAMAGLTKPFFYGELLAVVRQVLAEAERKEALERR